MKRLVSLFLTACGASTPQQTPAVVHVEPVAIAVDAGPACVEPIDEPPPKFVGTYPKLLPRLSNEAWVQRTKMLLDRNPGVDAFFVDPFGGAIRGFTSKKSPLEPANAAWRFVAGGTPLGMDEVAPLLEEMRCANPDVAHFSATWAHLTRAANLDFIVAFERHPTPTEDLIRDEPLPAVQDDDTLAKKWSVTVEVARVHRVRSFSRRVVVGKIAVPPKYLKVIVFRSHRIREAGIELRMLARVTARWDELLGEVVRPRFGSTLEPALAGNFQDQFDAVTGDAYDPTAS